MRQLLSLHQSSPLLLSASNAYTWSPKREHKTLNGVVISHLPLVISQMSCCFSVSRKDFISRKPCNFTFLWIRIPLYLSIYLIRLIT